METHGCQYITTFRCKTPEYRKKRLRHRHRGVYNEYKKDLQDPNFHFNELNSSTYHKNTMSQDKRESMNSRSREVMITTSRRGIRVQRDPMSSNSDHKRVDIQEFYGPSTGKDLRSYRTPVRHMMWLPENQEHKEFKEVEDKF